MKNVNRPVRSNEATYYVSYEDIDVYRRKDSPDATIPGTQFKELDETEREQYEWYEDGSQARFDTFKRQLSEKMIARYKSMQLIDKMTSRKCRVLLSSDAFDIVLKDEGWAFGRHNNMFTVKINRNTKDTTARQKKYIHSTARAVRDILLTLVPTIYIRTGDFTAAPITTEIAREMDRAESKAKREHKKAKESAQKKANAALTNKEQDAE